MSVKGEVDQERVERLIRGREAGRESRKAFLEAYTKARAESLRTHLLALKRDAFESRQALSRERAKDRFAHREEILGSLISEPKFIPGVINRHIEDWFSDAQMEQFMGGRYIA
jgi:hypothetical protein